MKIPFFPEQASNLAPSIDLLYFVLIALSLFFSILVISFVVYFSIKYRRGTQVDRNLAETDNLRLEITWTAIPTVLAIVVFTWAAVVFFRMTVAPDDALEIFVVGKQWMWKVQHPGGQREINALHVPVGQPVKLTMTSEDVIHSFSIPAFRVKRDTVPGRYTTQWFEATRPGEYHLFCAEYCGTEHAMMIGTVYALEPDEYKAWLAAAEPEDTPVARGERLINRHGCVTCHREGAVTPAPLFDDLYMSEVEFTDGTTAIADEEYLRNQILNPMENVVAGYTPLMPSFAGQLSEEELMDIIAYIKSLSDEVDGVEELDEVEE